MKTKLLRFALLSFCLSATQIYALTVDSSECPNPVTPFITGPNCLADWTCQRTDNPGVLTSAGTLTDVDRQILNCDSCTYCNYEDKPPPVTCQATLTVSFTETHNYSINPGIRASAKVIEGSLAGTIGWGTQLTYSYSVTCGTSSWPACKKAYPAFSAYMQAWKGRAATVTSTYTWLVQSHASPPCFSAYTEDCGSRDSTASGTKAKEGSATCKTEGAPGDC